MEVVCIKDDWKLYLVPGMSNNIICPIKDQIYTVSGIEDDSYYLAEVPVVQHPYIISWKMRNFISFDEYKKEALKEELNNIFQKIPV